MPVLSFFFAWWSAGLRALEKPIYKEPFSRHRPVMNLYEK
jgi:hypothetical protein